MDADGVMTDGRLYHLVDARGRLEELKGVDTQDGIALAWLADNGIQTGLISGRSSRGLAARARMLRMRFVVQGTTDKLPAFARILARARLKPEQAAFMGDDLPDLPVLRRAGWAVAPANARPEIKRAVHRVTRARGGRGAIREAAETLLKAQGRWRALAARYGA